MLTNVLYNVFTMYVRDGSEYGTTFHFIWLYKNIIGGWPYKKCSAHLNSGTVTLSIRKYLVIVRVLMDIVHSYIYSIECLPTSRRHKLLPL